MTHRQHDVTNIPKSGFHQQFLKSGVEKLRNQYLDFCKIAVLLAVCDRNANKKKIEAVGKKMIKIICHEILKNRNDRKYNSGNLGRILLNVEAREK